MKAFVLAAGDGTRLGELTRHTPKPLLPYGGKPLLQHTFEWLARHGVREIVINTHNHAWQFVDRFGTGEALGITLHYSLELHLLGTAGSVRKMVDMFDDPFLVVYGDNYYDLDLDPLYAAHWRHGARTELGLAELPDQSQGSAVRIDRFGKIEQFLEKPPGCTGPGFGFAGLAIVDPGWIKADVAPGQIADFGRDLFPRWIADNRPGFCGTGLPGLIVDTGTPAGHARVRAMFGEASLLPEAAPCGS
jgi:NDP-sugar pyrophosphorylase family protein